MVIFYNYNFFIYWKDYEKRLMVTNVSSEQKGDITQVSKLHSDGSYYTYEINKKIKLSDHQLFWHLPKVWLNQ